MSSRHTPFLVQLVLFQFCNKFCFVKASKAADAPRELQRLPVLGEWLRRDIQHCHFKDYDLTFAFYSKFPSWGCPSKPIYSSAYNLNNPFLSLYPSNISKSYNFVKINSSFQKFIFKDQIIRFSNKQNSSNCSPKINSLLTFLKSDSHKLGDNVTKFYYFLGRAIKFLEFYA